jgi:TonB-dependent receptor
MSPLLNKIFKHYLSLGFLLFHSSLFAAVIKGKVIHAGTHEPLIGAIVHIKDTKIAAVTDVEGHFSMSGLAPGVYELVASYLGYEDSQGVQVTIVHEADEKQVNFHLHEKEHHTKEVEVTGKTDKESDISARKQEKEADNVINVVSARTIELSPDITVANVAQRVSGISLVRTAQGDGRYAIIRGMDPRYSNTLVNGVKIPSPDNENRFIPLDMIPADLLQKLEVHKTLMPDMEADATGGTINAVMKKAPDTVYVSANASMGYSQLMLDRPYSHFDVGSVNKIDPSDRYPPGTPLKATDFSRGNLNFNDIHPNPNSMLGATVGRRFFHNKLGFILSASNQITYSGTNSQLNGWSYQRSDLITLFDYINRRFSTRQNRSGINAHVDFKINERHTISFSNVYLRMTMDESLHTIDTTGYNGQNGRVGPGTGYISFLDRSRIQIQQIESANLSGVHALLKNLTLDWSAAYALANSDQPDMAVVNTHLIIDYNLNKHPPYFNSANRTWQRNYDRDFVGMANLSYRVPLLSGTCAFKIGGLYRDKSRENHQNDFTLFPNKVNGSDPVFMGPNYVDWYVYGGLGTPLYNTNNYTAEEYITDYYIQNKLEFRKWNAVYGVRFENTEQHWYVPYRVKVQDPVANTPRPYYLDILPSINLKYLVNDKMNIKLAYYKSLMRPQFAEFIPVRSGLAGDNSITDGNPILKHAVAFNYEARYEWFPNRRDVLMVGVFYKEIHDAIENKVDLNGPGGSFIKKPYNAGTAVNKGFEINGAKYFEKIHLLRNFGITFNYTFTLSQVTTLKSQNVQIYANYDTLIQKNEVRPLQNQSRDLLNVSLIYSMKKLGFNIQLAYLYQGKRLVNVQQYYELDWYQKPLQSLSFSCEKKVGRHLFIILKLNNLLNSPYEVVINKVNLLVQKDTYGQTYQIGLRFKL